ncbi:S41 family peptidase [Kangiella geojedonensis]|uniref:Peptidase S41 n=1 Tax=Kangiella geojedonensis TaxID=914150 RepID=A0A0F6RC90_9GAMM|nr:S41 family peptidase [Kangiella geojedonensis]AKE52228.1 Peptidase S41 [Kangiella geojedonensis]
MNTERLKTKLLSLAATALVLTACGGSSDSDSPSPQPPTSEGPTWTAGVFADESNFVARCENPRSGTDIYGDPWPDQAGSHLHEKHWLRSWSNNTYLWYDEIQDQNPANFGLPTEYFAELKTEELTSSGAQKDNFHFFQDTNDYQQRVSSGASSGYGARFFLIQAAPPRKIVIAYTEPSSPATGAGLTRGTEILEIDGVDVINGSDTDTLNAGLFPASDGETHEFVVRDLGASTTRTVTMTSATVTADPVQNEQVFDTASGKVGYMQFNTFGTRIAEQEIIDAFVDFSNEGVQDLVVDLRYNGGGFLFISSQLAYMVAGQAQTQGQIYEESVWNDKHPNVNPVTGEDLNPIPFYNTTSDEATAPGGVLPSVNLNRVFVLSTSGTCSASEAFINGLRGIDVEVILIGDTTCGKPYGFYATDNCGTTYFTIQFRGENQKGFGQYADGFVPSSTDNGQDFVKGCVVADDFNHLLGDPDEAMLAAALEYQSSGTCPATVEKTAQRHSYKGQMPDNSLLKSQRVQERLFLEQNRIMNTPKELQQ